MPQSQLPEYENPPVREVVLGVHFEALEKLAGAYIGLLWQQFRGSFPKVEQKDDVIVPGIEAFPVPAPIELPLLLTRPPRPRTWFVNDSGTELLQVQDNWFSHNWRKVREEDLYPRYSTIRTSFSQELDLFLRFLSAENIGVLTPLQCEVTYVNLIPCGADASLEDLLSVFRLSFSDAFLKTPEFTALSMTFTIGTATPVARLHISAQPAINRETGARVFQLSLTARGKPGGESTDDILALLDTGHEWIVRSFTSATTPKMHQEWRRIR